MSIVSVLSALRENPEALALLAAVLFAAGLATATLRPGWLLPLVLVLVPVRLPLDFAWNPATPLLLGMVLGRAPAILRMLRGEPLFAAATALLPLWIVLSSLWALQSAFVPLLLAKWGMVLLAAWLAAADEMPNARVLVVALVVAIVPHALWAVAERLHWLAPIGDSGTLEWRGIDFQGAVRGKALFWHPNRLAEFTEEGGLVLVGAAMGGVLPWLAGIGVAAAMAAAWATGSTGGMATIFGGTMLCLGWMLMVRRLWPSHASADAGVGVPAAGSTQRIATGGTAPARRRALWILGIAILGAAVAGAVAFVTHGGIGNRQMVFAFAGDQIAARPWLGAGAGNWSLLVGSSSLELSRFWFRGHAHSLPLQVWVELGAVGVVLVAVFFLVPLASVWPRLRALTPAWRGIGTGASFAILGILAHNLVHYFLRDPIDGIMTGLMLGLVISAARRAPSVRRMPAAPAGEVAAPS